jgi:1-acyl-sn-glycerol-3-phosphate acyltransferase
MADTSVSRKENAAVARWKPGYRWYYPALAWLVISTSRFITSRMNTLEVDGANILEAALMRGDRGLLTISNHVSLFDDPILVANFVNGPYREIRWVGADAFNFFGTAPKSWLFTAGRSVPIVRGGGIDQPGMRYLRDRLAEGAWVHMFPEGGRTRDRQATMQQFHPGVGWLVAESRPIVLPFYHHGMHRVLPVGAIRPRGGNKLRVKFGTAIDCGPDWLSSVSRNEEPTGSGPPLWAAIARGLWRETKKLEDAVNPAGPEFTEVRA